MPDITMNTPSLKDLMTTTQTTSAIRLYLSGMQYEDLLDVTPSREDWLVEHATDHVEKVRFGYTDRHSTHVTTLSPSMYLSFLDGDHRESIESAYAPLRAAFLALRQTRPAYTLHLADRDTIPLPGEDVAFVCADIVEVQDVLTELLAKRWNGVIPEGVTLMAYHVDTDGILHRERARLLEKHPFDVRVDLAHLTLQTGGDAS